MEMAWRCAKRNSLSFTLPQEWDSHLFVGWQTHIASASIFTRFSQSWKQYEAQVKKSQKANVSGENLSQFRRY
jgi:hypothetical protein